MNGDAARDGAQYLSGSPVRGEILRTLRSTPSRPAELTDTVSATRTTVQRILAGFREREWVVKRDGAYHVTASGIRVHDAYEELLDEVELADRYGRFAADLERVGAEFPPSGLGSGTLTVADERDPLAAVDRVVEILRDGSGSDVTAISPIVTRQYNEAAAVALDRGARIELVIDHDVLEASVSNFASATDRALEDDNATVHVASDSIGFGLFHDGEIACVISHDERNNPRCVFESTDPEVLEWGTAQFTNLVADATPLSSVIDG